MALVAGGLILASSAPASAGHRSHHHRSHGSHQASATLTQTVATRVGGALDVLDRLESDLTATDREARTVTRNLSLWELRRGTSAGWVREAATGLDQMLDLLDPMGALPRLGLERYRILTVRPVGGELTSTFGVRYHPVLHRRKLHTGCDFEAHRGTPVMAAAPGVVIRAGRWSSYGRIVIIDHGMGVHTRYAHLSRIYVHTGDYVGAGALLGKSGASGRVTGPHLHFEVRVDGEPIDPIHAFAVLPPPSPTDSRVASRTRIGIQSTRLPFSQR